MLVELFEKLSSIQMHNIAEDRGGSRLGLQSRVVGKVMLSIGNARQDDTLLKKLYKSASATVPFVECKYCTGNRQSRTGQISLSTCLCMLQSLCSICSQSMLTSLVSILQSEILSDWSICSNLVAS